jgi:hypothetical protein
MEPGLKVMMACICSKSGDGVTVLSIIKQQIRSVACSLATCLPLTDPQDDTSPTRHPIPASSPSPAAVRAAHPRPPSLPPLSRTRHRRSAPSALPLRPRRRSGPSRRLRRRRAAPQAGAAGPASPICRRFGPLGTSGTGDYSILDVTLSFVISIPCVVLVACNVLLDALFYLTYLWLSRSPS